LVQTVRARVLRTRMVAGDGVIHAPGSSAGRAFVEVPVESLFPIENVPLVEKGVAETGEPRVADLLSAIVRGLPAAGVGILFRRGIREL